MPTTRNARAYYLGRANYVALVLMPLVAAARQPVGLVRVVATLVATLARLAERGRFADDDAGESPFERSPDTNALVFDDFDFAEVEDECWRREHDLRVFASPTLARDLPGLDWETEERDWRERADAFEIPRAR